MTRRSRVVLTAAQATDVVLRRDRTLRRDREPRCSESFAHVVVKDGVLGDFRLDRHGDITPAQIADLPGEPASAPPDARVFDWFRGSVVDRVMTVPKSLSG